MTIRRALKLTAVALVVTAAWYAWPVYQFYAHRGGASLPPTGWLTLPAAAPAQQQVFVPEFQVHADRALALLGRYREQIAAPALSAAVAIDGRVVWAGATGFADIETRTPATPQTLFRIGSTSKALTATALARLADRQVIDLDVPISQYLSPLPNAGWTQITARQLASHSAGVPHYKQNREWTGLYRMVALNRHYGDVRDSLALFDDSPLLHPPGTAFHYSSLGTVLLGAVMSEAAGVSYRALMQREVLGPAQMASTFAEGDRDRDATGLASFYLARDGRFRRWRRVDLSHRLPAGGFVSSPSDLVQLGAKLLDDDYLSATTREAFWTPQKLADGTVNEQNYALGWRWREWNIDGIGLTRNANHGGVSRGSQSWLLVFPDYAMSVAFCINTNTDQFHHFGMLYEPLVKLFVTGAE